MLELMTGDQEASPPITDKEATFVRGPHIAPVNNVGRFKRILNMLSFKKPADEKLLSSTDAATQTASSEIKTEPVKVRVDRKSGRPVQETQQLPSEPSTS